MRLAAAGVGKVAAVPACGVLYRNTDTCPSNNEVKYSTD